jgi:hypothetical protein
MMKAASPLLLIAVLANSCFGAIDFNPASGERVLDGVKFQQLIFQQGGRKITYEQPRGWKYIGDSSRIAFTPPQVSQAEACIEQSLLSTPANFDEPTIKALQEKVLVSVPAGSQKIELVSAEKNPLIVNQHETFEVIVSYENAGLAFSRSVLFLNLPDTQLRFCVTARKADFEKIHKAFRGSIFSWQWL